MRPSPQRRVALAVAGGSYGVGVGERRQPSTEPTGAGVAARWALGASVAAVAAGVDDPGRMPWKRSLAHTAMGRTSDRLPMVTTVARVTMTDRSNG
jgi:hypothetical protein